MQTAQLSVNMTPRRQARVVSDPDILGGMPVVEGTRVPAATIVAYIRGGYSEQEIREDYPTLPPDGIDAVRIWQAAHA